MEFKDLSLEEIIAKIKGKETTPKAVFDYFLGRIEKYDDKLKVFNYINKKWLQSDINTHLAWVPIAVKDIFCEKWIPTTWSSVMLKDFVPTYDATVIKRLKEAWMSSIWKVNNDEFAMWSSWENSAFYNTLNPWWTNRIPGWTSSGSAAAVAAWLVPAALWTDTWWSLRQPASMCNVVWLRASYGRNPRYGVMPMASSFDCPWVITKTVKDTALLYNIMNGNDPLENTSLPWKDIIDEKIWETKDLKWIKIGLPKEYFEDWLDDWVRQKIAEAVKKMKELWAEIKEVSLPMTKYAIAAYYIIVPAEVSTNLWRLDWIRYGHMSEKIYNNLNQLYLNNRWEWLWNEAKRRTILWSYVLSAWFYDDYFMKAAKVRTLIIEEFDKVFSEVDVIVTPVSPSVAWKIWDKSQDPLKMYFADAYTLPASLAWLPWISVPCWFAKSEDEEKEELPVGLQILAPRLEEQKLLEVAYVYEQATLFGKMSPKGF